MVATVITKALSATSRIGLIAAVAASAIGAVPAVAGPEQLVHIRASQVTSPPVRWVEFCARQPGECASTATAPVTSLSHRGLEGHGARQQVGQQDDQTADGSEHWGVVERWSYPDDGYGDCEDYVLLKRRIFIQSGWPRESHCS